jgi:hypothetical protein
MSDLFFNIGITLVLSGAILCAFALFIEIWK